MLVDKDAHQSETISKWSIWLALIEALHCSRCTTFSRHEYLCYTPALRRCTSSVVFDSTIWRNVRFCCETNFQLQSRGLKSTIIVVTLQYHQKRIQLLWHLDPKLIKNRPLYYCTNVLKWWHIFLNNVVSLRVRMVAKKHVRSPMFTASFILVSCGKLP